MIATPAPSSCAPCRGPTSRGARRARRLPHADRAPGSRPRRSRTSCCRPSAESSRSFTRTSWRRPTVFQKSSGFDSANAGSRSPGLLEAQPPVWPTRSPVGADRADHHRERAAWTPPAPMVAHGDGGAVASRRSSNAACGCRSTIFPRTTLSGSSASSATVVTPTTSAAMPPSGVAGATAERDRDHRLRQRREHLDVRPAQCGT